MKACAVEGCPKEPFTRSMCSMHYSRLLRTGTVGPVESTRNDPRRRDAEGRKHCVACNQWLAVENFGLATGRCDGLHFRCRSCDRAAQTRWKYGIDSERFEELLESQGECCAICRADEPGGSGTWHVDHDHSCCPGRAACGDCVRGLLCSRCNVMLGMAQDDPARLTAAVDYLRTTMHSRVGVVRAL